MIDPRNLLFSLPTISDGIPAVDGDSSVTRESEAVLFHEDRWRQEEFLPVANRAFIVDRLSQLESHRAVHSQGLGFREVFVRTEVPFPLVAAGIATKELRALFESAPVPIYFLGSRPGRVLGGFGFLVADIGFIYGQDSGGVVAALGIGLVGSGFGEVDRIALLSGRFDLLFVDWLRGIVIEPGDRGEFRAWIDAIIYQDPDHTI